MKLRTAIYELNDHSILIGHAGQFPSGVAEVVVTDPKGNYSTYRITCHESKHEAALFILRDLLGRSPTISQVDALANALLPFLA